MQYTKIVELVREKINKSPDLEGHFAVQVNIIGEGEGIFYIEVSEGKTDVQPYDYVDRNVLIITDAEQFLSFLDGNSAVFKTEGNDAMVSCLGKLIATTEKNSQIVKPVERVEEELPQEVVKTVTKVLKKAPAKKDRKKSAKKVSKKMIQR